MSTFADDAAPAVLAAAAQEHATKMEAQFARFTALMAEIKRQMSSLADAHRQEQQQSDASSASVAAQMQQSYLLFLELKAVSRQITNMAETTKAQVQNRKKRVDVLNLQCESIKYERAHFLKEIAIAADFHSKYAVPELVDDAEFARAHPDAASLAPHPRWLARLRDEHARRESLLTSTQSLAAQNATRADANDEMRRRKKLFNDNMKAVYTTLRDAEKTYFTSQTAEETTCAPPTDK